MFSLKRKNQQEIIAQIHNEFDTAQERLLAEATNILNQPNKAEIGDLHARLGFVNAPAAKTAMVIKGDMQAAKQTAELVNYYMVNYPFQKFLTEEQLNTICEKYGLIHAPIANYIKNVPEKNLRDIESAKPLKNVDCAENTYVLRVLRFSKNCPQELRDIFKKGLVVSKEDARRGDRHFIDCAQRYAGYVGDYEGFVYTGGDAAVDEYSKKGLFIAAPKSHFNLEGLKSNSKYGFKHVFTQEVKDPIVFRYCKGGIQVITKWGIEAQDELVQNQIDN